MWGPKCGERPKGPTGKSSHPTPRCPGWASGWEECPPSAPPITEQPLREPLESRPEPRDIRRQVSRGPGPRAPGLGQRWPPSGAPATGCALSLPAFGWEVGPKTGSPARPSLTWPSQLGAQGRPTAPVDGIPGKYVSKGPLTLTQASRATVWHQERGGRLSICVVLTAPTRPAALWRCPRTESVGRDRGCCPSVRWLVG